MKTEYEIQANRPWGWAVLVRVTTRAGTIETHSEGTHKTKAAAERAVRSLKYAASMASADGFVRPRGM